MNICILGAGSWGTAMALHMDRCGHSVALVPRRIEQALEIASSRENVDYLPGHLLPHSIQIGHELAPVLMEAEVVILACPSKGLRDLCLQVAENIKPARQLKLLLSLCKGLELTTFKTPSEIINEVLPEIFCGALSGPSYAVEVAQGQPTAVTLALSADLPDAVQYQTAFSNKNVRAYLSNDVKGTELGGSLKNIYAIAAGLCDGQNLGDNAKAALLTRCMKEMVVLGESLGGQANTFYGLSGFGDLVATCNGEWSRNRSFGQRVGQGESPQEIIESQKSVVEGYRAARCLSEFCEQNSLDAPILEQIFAICYEGKDPQLALQNLMKRELRSE